MSVKSIIYRIAFVFVILLVPFRAYLQDVNGVKKSDNKVIIEGKVYYVHVVKPGNTLYAISKAYGVQEKEIALENPGVYSGLQIGQVLKIPFEATMQLENTEAIDHKKLIKHNLKVGETLYQLSRFYKVSVSDIMKMNPDLDYANLSVGSLILIPPPVIERDEDSYYYHKVRRRETVYSLSREYNVEREEIYKSNPELEIAGLKIGQTIRIPKIVETVEIDNLVIDSLLIDTLLIDSLGVKIPVDSLELTVEEGESLSLKDYSRRLKSFNRRRIKVAFLIPFDYFTEMEDDSLTDQIENVKDEVNLEEERLKKLPKSVNFLEFFEGSLMAIEKLKSEGINVELKYYDTQKSPAKVREILSTDFMQDIDLIIGPFYSWNVEIVNEFSKEKGVPLVSPFYDNNSLTENSPFLFQINPSYKIEYQAAAKMLAKDYDKSFLFIYGTDSINMIKADYFKNSLLGALNEYTNEESVVLKELVYENAAKSDLSEDLAIALSRDKKNIVVIPETNEAFVSNLITQLYFQQREFDIEVFGMPHFAGFENVQQEYFHSLKLKFVSPYYFSYSDSAISEFLIKFRTKFKAEPMHFTKKGFSYACLGYDLSYFFIKSISTNQNRFVETLSEFNQDEILMPIQFLRNSDYAGFENYYLDLIEFKTDFGVEVTDVSKLIHEAVEPEPSWNIWDGN